MAGKSKTVWYCTSCGNESSKWMGRCPACGQWNTMQEAPVERAGRSSGTSKLSVSASGRAAVKPMKLQEISSS